MVFVFSSLIVYYSSYLPLMLQCYKMAIITIIIIDIFKNNSLYKTHKQIL